MLSAKRLALLVALLYAAEVKAASFKKNINEAPEVNKILDTPKIQSKKSSPPAIIAIEIVDEPEKNTTGKNTSKRTIESSLGYGFHGPPNSYNNQNNKKFVIYKYSQHDIPPSSSYQYINRPHGPQAEIQKSIEYNLGSVTSHGNLQSYEQTPSSVYNVPKQTSTQYYNPGNTFYATYDQQGLGGISNQIPYQQQQQPGVVPVILLKVYSNQLTNPNTALYTDLPQSHPYSELNNVNIQSYLQNYLQQYLETQRQPQPQPQPQQQVVYQPTYDHSQSLYSQNYQDPIQYQSSLQTYENYPSDQHTKVVFHSNTAQVPVSASYKVSESPSASYKSVSFPMYVAPQQEQSQDLQYEYGIDDANSKQSYMYYYPSDVYQDQVYQQNNRYYQQAETDPRSSISAEAEATSAPYNYHAHPKKQVNKEKRNKPLYSEEQRTSKKAKQS
ncbi:hypothetical protein FQA39_LY00567 [Lamprigera yunnana]|nr:hypothetical protein FQA39_LY00567 [Lamprigera yunnana]